MVLTMKPETEREIALLPTARKRKAMVIGSGGREHALAWKLRQELYDVLFVPGNAGVPDEARRDVKPMDFQGQFWLAKSEKADLVIVGPEDPLAAGIVDYFHKMDSGFPIFGPDSKSAQLESSKVFSKRFMAYHNIPTAEFVVADSFEDTEKYGAQFLSSYGTVVLKKDGLAAGKGVFVCRSREDLENALPQLKNDRVVVEKCLQGEEVSYIVFTDGYDILPLLPTQDHKAIYDGDTGPNTGGMGAYTRPRMVTPAIKSKIEKIMLKAIRGMAESGRPYKSILYGGFMVVDGEPYVLEFNCRFGDPETQPVMALMKSSLAELAYASMEGTIGRSRIGWNLGEALTVVLTTQGYPGDYSRNTSHAIHGLEKEYGNVVVFHAGTQRTGNSIVNSGGRVLGVTGIGRTLSEARKNTYNAIGLQGVNFDGMHYRRDIGYRSLR